MNYKVAISVKDEHQNEIKSYDVLLKHDESISDVYQEARQVWDEYYVELNAASVTLSNSYTYKQEMMERQWLLDLHEELAGEE